MNYGCIFDDGDKVVFYAEGANRIKLKSNNVLYHENNFYSDYNYYFLNTEQAIGEKSPPDLIINASGVPKQTLPDTSVFIQ